MAGRRSATGSVWTPVHPQVSSLPTPTSPTAAPTSGPQEACTGGTPTASNLMRTTTTMSRSSPTTA
eukprot:3794743-Lingulodinium_polyedra.AAC.1